ncbi:MAG: Rrf2 family transcriptional regulator [Deltaproteobacteria bacterium]|nr:Rrf2 family transcriptional regulator [Deltaproteobacteria bacterium]
MPQTGKQVLVYQGGSLLEKLLNISEAASLALHAVAFMAGNDSPDKSTTREIAHVIAASEHHLSKVMQRLTKAKLVRPIRGPNGGFMLARPAGKITLLEVFEAIDGKLETGDCLLAEPVCVGPGCILGNLLKNINNQVRDYLDGTRLSDLKVRYKAVSRNLKRVSSPSKYRRR